MEVTPARNSVGLPIEREDTKEFLSIVEESVVEDVSKRISLDEAPEVLGCYNICGHLEIHLQGIQSVRRFGRVTSLKDLRIHRNTIITSKIIRGSFCMPLLMRSAFPRLAPLRSPL
jgi:hypothetical protein